MPLTRQCWYQTLFFAKQWSEFCIHSSQSHAGYPKYINGCLGIKSCWEVYREKSDFYASSVGETDAYPLTNVSAFWAGQVENWPGQVEFSLQWRHNGHNSVSNHQPYECLLNRLFRRRSKKTSKLRVTGLCARNSPGTGEFPAQMASYAENVSIWRRHHGIEHIKDI